MLALKYLHVFGFGNAADYAGRAFSSAKFLLQFVDKARDTRSRQFVQPDADQPVRHRRKGLRLYAGGCQENSAQHSGQARSALAIRKLWWQADLGRDLGAWGIASYQLQPVQPDLREFRGLCQCDVDVVEAIKFFSVLALKCAYFVRIALTPDGVPAALALKVASSESEHELVNEVRAAGYGDLVSTDPNQPEITNARLHLRVGSHRH